MEITQEQLSLAKSAKKSINTASTALKNQALEAMASQLLKATGAILAANQIDMDCLLYTSDAADERSSVDLGGRRIIKKKKKKK